MDFIFMLTRNDRTVADADDHLAVAQALGVRHIGFKDIGLPFHRLHALNRMIRNGGAVSYLEVVSEAVEIGVDVLLGGTHAEEVLPVLAGSGIRYMPFPGRVTGHPSVLNGPVEEIVASAARLAGLEGVHGLDLLAWRFAGEVPPMIARVCAAAGKPVIVAGSIESADRIVAAASAGAAGFTIGTAALDGAFKGAGPGLEAQLRAIQTAVAAIGHGVGGRRER